MSLPPALLQRLAQRGLVNKKKQKESETVSIAAENEEVIAEDYDEVDTEQSNQQDPDEFPSQYEDQPLGISSESTVRKRTEENWLERMKALMGEAGTAAGYKGCPNKYNIWHKCNLYCVNRWADGRPEPSRDYMRRYKRLLRKYPLPKGWTEMYDSGCGCFYFYSATDGVVSWLPPTHPKSQVSKSAAAYRRQMEEANGEGGTGIVDSDSGSDGEQQADEIDEPEIESAVQRHQREVDEIINSAMRPRSPPSLLVSQNFPSLQEGIAGMGGTLPPRKQKSRDLERTLSRQRRDREQRGGFSGGGRRRAELDALDPMDPSAYSDTPRGKWSDGLQTGGANEERKKSAAASDSERRNVESEGDDEDADEGGEEPSYR